MLSSEEISRYSRQIILDEIGEEGQLKLKHAKVLVVGAGGLGVPVLQYLAATGVGKIGVVDGDVIEISNLQRQVLYSTSDVTLSTSASLSVNSIEGRKSEVAREKLLRLNSEIEIIAYSEFLSSENAERIFSDYEIIIDGSDN